jgi:hypothetical protein
MDTEVAERIAAALERIATQLELGEEGAPTIADSLANVSDSLRTDGGKDLADVLLVAVKAMKEKSPVSPGR